MKHLPHTFHDVPRNDARTEPPQELALTPEQRALIERAQQLGATAAELGAALDALALQAEAVLHRLRGGRIQ